MTSHRQPVLEHVTCPLCGPEAGQEVRYEFPPFAVVTCRACGLMFLSPRLTEEDILQLYQDQEYYDSSVAGRGYDEYLNVRRNWVKTFRRRLRRIARYKPGGRVLDVGCGPGFFLEAAEEMGYEAWGLDPSAYIVRVARERFGDRVRQGVLERSGFEAASFDLLVAFDTFEHIYHPLEWLEAARRHLKADGVLAITTPNPESLLARLSGRGWVSFKMPEHVFYWSPRTIRKALERTGFGVLEIRRAGQYATLGFLFRRLFKLGEPSPALRPLLALLNRISIYADNGSMTVIARNHR